MLKRSKPQVKTVTVWSEDDIEKLKGCFWCTDWDIFNDTDIDMATEMITGYINFCVDNVLNKKDIIVYPNNKPHITKELKDCINGKKAAFRNKDRVELKTTQKELNQLLKKARSKQKDTIEQHFTTMNSKKLWDSMKAITNMEPSKMHIYFTDDLQKANELNDFYLRF